MARHRIVLDCDPGQDDAVAILLALASPLEIELLAITTVAGNVPLERTTRNARAVVELTGRRDVPIHVGSARPLLQPLETAEHIHGQTGLNGVTLPEPTVPLAAAHAVDAIVEIVMGRPAGTVTLCPLGPLTNVALAMAKEPRLAARLEAIVLMGGARDLGNVTPAAEFNIHVDPHAAAIVFESGAPITMFGLDVTHQVLVTEERLRRVRALGTRVAEAVAGFLEFYNRFDQNRYQSPGAPLHDPCVIMHLLRPELFRGKKCRVDIETEGRFCRGRTLVDWWNQDQRPPNVTVMSEADADGFFDLLTERLARL